jgi:hypothetical protein
MHQLSYIKSRLKLELTKRFEKQLYFLERIRLKKTFKNSKELVLIYTIGKVGSSSVYDSLRKNKKFGLPVFHIHSLEPSRILEQKEYYKNSERGSVPFHLIQSSILSELLSNYSGKIYVISLIREPLNRELSSLFQDSFNFTSSSNLIDSDMDSVIENKLQALLKSLPEDEWFSNELEKVFGFDIYKMPFDIDKGYQIENKNNITLAFIRLESLRSIFPQAMKELFGRDYNLTLVDSNIGDDKFYNDAYKEIRTRINFSKSEIDYLLKTNFMQKFYKDQKDAIRKRWVKKI